MNMKMLKLLFLSENEEMYWQNLELSYFCVYCTKDIGQNKNNNYVYIFWEPCLLSGII